MSFAPKSALVTGGSGGIGSAIVEELLKNGIKILAVLDISPEEPSIVQEWRKKFPGVTVKYYRVDVTSQEELEKCYAEFVKEAKNLDVVVNCAGIFNENIAKRVVDVNLGGVILSTIVAIEHMRANGKGKGGVILNIASIAGLEPFGMAPTYCATKHGVIAFTRAMDHKRDFLGIRFLSLCPGTTDTDLYNNCFKLAFMPTKGLEDTVRSLLVLQTCEDVGKAALKYIQEGKSGSVWVIDSGKIMECPVKDIRL
ncbi:alcohol dehydrogenase 1-like [Phlebotomus argentipes]|uniref:alcohol dehydrogenase 1-like n=1 Tax=Phlebotomus argentipes TaxID=94469 RepID=UPI002892EB6F|nr:alcohol dehydrogenase 1-like [Phlebotomus argentipes]